MRKPFKIALTSLAILLAALIVGAAVGYHYLQGRPDFYRTYTWDAAQRSILSQRAADKLSATRNVAARAWSAETQARNSGQPVPATAPASVSITFTEEELNAFLLHNLELSGLKPKVEKYVSDPGIYLGDGALIFAGQVRDSGFLASFHFKPSLDDDGKLRLTLVKTLAGRLPVPSSMLSSYVQRLQEALRTRLPAWQHEATMDPAGAGNKSLVAASAARLLLAALVDQPAPAVLFMPLDEKGKKVLPLRIVEVVIEDSKLSLTLQPMNSDQRKSLLADVREPLRPLE